MTSELRHCCCCYFKANEISANKNSRKLEYAYGIWSHFASCQKYGKLESAKFDLFLLIAYVTTCNLLTIFYLFRDWFICIFMVCYVLLWTDASFRFMFWRWRNKLKWAPFYFFIPPWCIRSYRALHARVTVCRC